MRPAHLQNKVSRRFVALANIIGNPFTFMGALGFVVVWLMAGPFMHFSTFWLSCITTTTSIFTFLAIFVLQNTQNREIRAFQLKLDEIIRATEGAKNSMVSVEKLSDTELGAIGEEYQSLAEDARKEGTR
jgi:low affinity Fe/Cu permease